MESTGGTIGRSHVVVAVSGAVCAGGMCAGALGPWVRTPVINFSGWAGIGFPLVVLAFVVLAIQVLHGFVPRRVWLVLGLLLGALSLIAAIVLSLLVSLLSHAGNLLSFLFARGTHQELFSAPHAVTLGWGIPVLAVASFAEMLACIAGLFAHFPEPPFARFRRVSRASPLAEAPGASSVGDEDLFNTR